MRPRPVVGIFATQDPSVSEGGQATFICNLDPLLGRRFALRHIFLPEAIARRNVLPDRLLYFFHLAVYLAFNSRSVDAAVSHTPEASWLLSFTRVPFLHISHGNSNPFSISKFPFARRLSWLYPRVTARIRRKARFCLTVGEAAPGMERILTPVVVPAGVCAPPARRGIVFGGRLEKVKNVDRLIRIYGTLPEGVRREHPFLVVGRGSQEERLRKLAESLRLGDSVQWLGFRKIADAFQVYARAAVLLMASTTEGFPMVMAECLSVGTPVVTSAVGAIPSVIIDGENGFVLPLSDPDDAYARAILLMLENIRSFSRRAAESACAFSAERIAGALVSRIEAMLERGEADGGKR